jgi:serine/threonine-protein kinase
VQSQAGLTLTGDLVGTLRYMSPEQGLGRPGLVDHRADLYSLGVTLYELLTLEPAFPGDDRQGLLRQIACEEPRPPRWLNRAVPAELEVIVLKAMEKSPAERYATAQELADDLGRFLRDEPIRAKRPSLMSRARKWGRRHQALVAALVVCLFVIFTALGGSLGWVARDRAARQRQLRSDTERATQDAAGQLDAGNWPAAQQTMLRAQSLLAGGLDDERLRRRMADLEAELALVIRLEAIRSDVAIHDDSLDWKTTEARYAEAFREQDIDVDALPVEEAAAAVRRKRVHKELIAALHDWARVRRAIGHSGWKDLLRIAAELQRDDDSWSERLRHTLEEGESQALLELAAEAEHQDLSPGAVLLLSGAMETTCKRSQKAASGRSADDIVVGLLLKAQQDHPDDFWINFQLGYFLSLSQPSRQQEAVRYYSVALALRPHSPTARVNLGAVLLDQGKYDEALAVFQKARDLSPDLAMVHFNLGQALRLLDRWDEAIGEYREAVRLGARRAEAYHNLAEALARHGHPGEAEAASREAEAAYREIIRREPGDFRSHAYLGELLARRGELKEAEEQLREASRIKPDEAVPHLILGQLLGVQKRSKEAERELREGIRLRPDDGEAHYKLGTVLQHQGRLPEALDEFRTAVRLRPNDPIAHNNLGECLRDMGNFAEAEAELRKALLLKPDLVDAHYNLGLVYQLQEKLSTAESEYREVVRLSPTDAQGHCNLGLVLQQQGRFTEAVAELRSGHELGSRQPGWPYPSQQWVQECEALLALDAELPAILAGKAQPSDVAKRLRLAWLCQQPYKQLPATAARFYKEAFAAEPKLADDLRAGHRYSAARAAALAAAGQGNDAQKLEAPERARLRRQALDWLRADLAQWTRQMQKGSPQLRMALAGTLEHWQHDSDLAGVRGEPAMARMAAEEQPGWRQLWADVETTLAKARQENSGKEKSPDK